MTWTYAQINGELKHNGVSIVAGYAGFGKGKFNPSMQCVRNVGPLPRGKYIMKELILKHRTCGEYVIRLEPDPRNNMCGRSGFLIHGDSAKHPGFASQGCIILDKKYRKDMWNSGDKILEVIAK
ncbi:tlde1 domain-containing protein [Snodgrassella alvi]|uniref:tlde1 domain-containing protein n=1 Tax=Snodgrassella alvi TaxID=1196083 RepID=UPI003D03D860